MGHISRADDHRAWAASGAMALTGDASGAPLAPAAPLASVMAAAGRAVDDLAPGTLPDAPALLGERAALAGLARRGRVSCGGASRLLRAADGWAAVTLARPEDWESVDAWLGCPPTWGAIATAIAARPVGEAVEQGSLLELAVSDVPDSPVRPREAPWRVSHHIPAGPGDGSPLVVDLSSLWAGPLCADLLRRSGASVVKVEDPARPDGARRGNQPFFALLNGRKPTIAAALASREVDRLLHQADVVVTSARSRAFEQAGIDVDAILADSPTVWVAITAYGWSGAGAARVGFGDDAAAGAGLVARDPLDGEPRFVADAVADPLCGTLAALAALAARRAGGSRLIDASLSGTAGFVAGLAGSAGGPAAASIAARAGPDGWTVDDAPVLAPRARRG